MDKKTRIIVLIALIALGVGALVLAWMPSPAPAVDPAIVEAAAEGSRRAQQAQPPAPVEEPKKEGRARPGLLGGPSH